MTQAQVQSGTAAMLLGFVLLTGCADGSRPFRYEPPPGVQDADREHCHTLASAAAEKTYARYAATMGTDALGRRSGTTFGGTALAEYAWAQREAVYEHEMRACLSLKGYAD